MVLGYHGTPRAICRERKPRSTMVVINQLAAPPSLPSSAWTHTKTPWHSTLVLIRHGQSEWNAANRFTGWTDIDLTDEGRREAAAGAEALRDIGISRFDRAFTSELVAL